MNPQMSLKFHASMKQNGCLLFLCKHLECAHSVFLLVTVGQSSKIKKDRNITI